jgi:GntR family transcriptional regulator
MILKLNPGSGVPIYLQLMEQIKYAIGSGALRPGEQLPGIRKMAETLVMNPNTVAKAYRELEYEGVIEVRHGAGAFVAERGNHRQQADRMRQAQPIIQRAVDELRHLGLSPDEMRRLLEAVLLNDGKPLERQDRAPATQQERPQ